MTMLYFACWLQQVQTSIKKLPRRGDSLKDFPRYFAFGAKFCLIRACVPCRSQAGALSCGSFAERSQSHEGMQVVFFLGTKGTRDDL